MKRKPAWCIIALVVTIVMATLFLLWPGDPITRATYQKIQLGMTLEEAEAIVGSPGIGITEMINELKRRGGQRIDADPDDIVQEGNDWSKSRPDLTTIKCWEGTHGGIGIQLGDDGRIIGKRFEGRRQWTGLVNRVRGSLGVVISPLSPGTPGERGRKN